MDKLIPRIVGTGYAVPKKVRKNDDPIFDYLRDNPPPGQKIFAGYKERRVLGAEEDLIELMVLASEKALKAAKLNAADVDILLGAGSIGEYRNPNKLSQLHHKLKLGERVWAIPITNDFSNFNAAVLMADALLRAGRAKTILICVGCNWTSNVDYRTTQSISAGDGAGAVVMTLSDDITKFFIKDYCTISATKYYGGMFTAGAPVFKLNANSSPTNADAQMNFAPYPKNDKLYVAKGYDTLYTQHFFTINKLGLDGFKQFALPKAANSVLKLLKKNNLKSTDITYFPHQSTQLLIDAWMKQINPAQKIDTILKYGNIGMATEVINLSYAIEEKLIKKNNVVMMAMGDDIHVNSILLQKG